MQEETLAFLRSLKENVEELIPPIESAQEKLVEEAYQDRQKGIDLIMSDLSMVVILLTNVDMEISDEELKLINDMRHVVYGYGIPELTSKDYTGLFKDFLRLYPDKRLTLDHVPTSIRLLRTYDEEYNTDYAIKGVNLFIQFGEAIVKADQKQDFAESILLENFIDTLRAI
jgi:hypothetical protein